MVYLKPLPFLKTAIPLDQRPFQRVTIVDFRSFRFPRRHFPTPLYEAQYRAHCPERGAAIIRGQASHVRRCPRHLRRRRR